MEEERRKSTGEVVEGEIKYAELVEVENGGRERGGEEVAVKYKGAEVGETMEVRRERAVEGVVTEDEDTELIERGEGIWRESATERVVREGEADDAALLAFDALPFTVVKMFVLNEEEFVVEVRCGFEREQGSGVVHWLCFRL